MGRLNNANHRPQLLIVSDDNQFVQVILKRMRQMRRELNFFGLYQLDLQRWQQPCKAWLEHGFDTDFSMQGKLFNSFHYDVTTTRSVYE